MSSIGTVMWTVMFTLLSKSILIRRAIMKEAKSCQKWYLLSCELPSFLSIKIPMLQTKSDNFHNSITLNVAAGNRKNLIVITLGTCNIRGSGFINSCITSLANQLT